MSQGWRGLDWLPGVLAGTVTVAIFSLPAIALAKTPEEIYDIAKTRTVLIKNSSGGWGSGVIISHQGKTYKVLTNNHVACEQQGLSYTIFTYDDKSHPGKVLRCFMQQPNDPDLAVVSFEGTDNYPSAELANSDPVRIGASIYVYGYPGYLNDSVTERLAEPQFSPGYITSRSKLSKPPSGYGLGYSAVTWKGMSGGPVFDADGRVVGIHGLARLDEREIYQPDKDKLTELSAFALVETGFNLAIPINTFIVAARTEPTFSGLTVSNTPNTGKQANLVTPQTAEDFYVRGLTRADQGNKQAALADYNQALKLGLANPRVYWYRGNLRSELGDKQGAIEDYTRGIQADPEYAVVYYINRSVNYSALGNKRGSADDLNKAVELNPNAWTYFYRGAGKSEVFKDYQGATEDFNKAIQLDPKFAKAFAGRGYAYYKIDNKQKALSDFNQAIALNSQDAVSYDIRGTVRASLDDKQGAIQDYTRSIQLSPNNYSPFFNRGITYDELGKFQAAIEDYTQAIKLAPQRAEIYHNRGLARDRKTDIKGAIEDYTQAIQIAPENASSYSLRGAARSQLNDKKGASDDYTKVIQLNPKNGEAYYYRGVARYDLGEYKDAIEDLTQAIQLASENVRAHVIRGLARSQLNDKKGALDDYTKVISLDPKNGDAYYYSGGARYDLGEYKDAFDDLQQASRLYLDQKKMDDYEKAQKAINTLFKRVQ